MTDFGPEKEMTVTDPVCGMHLALEKVAAQEEHEGWAYFFCSNACRKLFLAAPERYASSPGQASSAHTGRKR